MKFEYRFFDGKFLPIVPIRIKGKSDTIELLAFIDTGASYCIFKADVAEILGLDFEKGEKTEMILGDGDPITVYLHKVLVTIADKELTAIIGFSQELKISFNIIGRKDIFEHFVVCFNEKEKWVGFKPLD